MGPMIPKILKPSDLEYTLAIIMPDLEQPWEIKNQITKWMNVLKDAVYTMTPNLELKQMEFFKERIEQLYRSYEEPEFDSNGKYISKRLKKAAELNKDQQNNEMNELDLEEQEMIEDLKKEIDLPEGTLVNNLFIPAMVVCSKIDLIQHGEKEVKDSLEQYIDFIQQDLRRFCLKFGAALVFASCNQNSNIELIYDYIISRLYDQEFPHPSNTSDKEALFIPTGLDSEDLIAQSTNVSQFLEKIK